MPSGTMICMTTDGLEYLGPFYQNASFQNIFQAGSAFKDMDIFHLILCFK